MRSDWERQKPKKETTKKIFLIVWICGARQDLIFRWCHPLDFACITFAIEIRNKGRYMLSRATQFHITNLSTINQPTNQPTYRRGETTYTIYAFTKIHVSSDASLATVNSQQGQCMSASFIYDFCKYIKSFLLQFSFLMFVPAWIVCPDCYDVVYSSFLVKKISSPISFKWFIPLERTNRFMISLLFLIFQILNFM